MYNVKEDKGMGKKEKGVKKEVMHSFNLSTGEAEAGRSLEFNNSLVHRAEIQVCQGSSEKPCLENREGEREREREYFLAGWHSLRKACSIRKVDDLETGNALVYTECLVGYWGQGFQGRWLAEMENDVLPYGEVFHFQ